MSSPSEGREPPLQPETSVPRPPAPVAAAPPPPPPPPVASPAAPGYSPGPAAPDPVPPSGGPPPAGPGPSGDETPHARKRSVLRELPVLIVVAFAAALLIKTFLLQAFYIPSASMEDTLRKGDRVLVEKLSYRLGEPERGDVVVFEKDLAVVTDPAAPEVNEPFWIDIAEAIKGLFGFPTGTSQDFIKRVIGVEGDHVDARDGRVLVNGEVVEEPYVPNGAMTLDFSAPNCAPTDSPAETGCRVPEGMIFVMGDNRNNSDDSRHFGPVSVDVVVGRAFLLIWPPVDFGTL